MVVSLGRWPHIISPEASILGMLNLVGNQDIMKDVIERNSICMLVLKDMTRRIIRVLIILDLDMGMQGYSEPIL